MQITDRFKIVNGSKVMDDIIICVQSHRIDDYKRSRAGVISFCMCADNINSSGGDHPNIVCPCGHSFGLLEKMPMKWPEDLGGYVHAAIIRRKCPQCRTVYKITFGSYTG